MAKLKLKVTRQSEGDKSRFPCCGLPSNHNHTHKRLGGSSIETKNAYQLSQVNELLSRTLGLPCVSSQGYNVLPKPKLGSGWEALGGSGKSKCQLSQVRELLERTIIR